jgi:type II secretory pathway component GspD/PulD (secretin)
MRHVYTFLAILFLFSARSEAATEALIVDVVKFGQGVRVRLRASIPYEFSVRSLIRPDRLVVDLKGLKITRVVGLGQFSLHPILAIRAPTRTSGPLQLVVDLSEPVTVDTEVQARGKVLVLLLRTRAVRGVPNPITARSPPIGSLSVETVRPRYVSAHDVAAQVRRLLQDLTVLVNDNGNSLVLRGPAEIVAQAKQLISALDIPPPNSPVTEAVPLKVLKPDLLGPLLAAMFPEARIGLERRLNAVIVSAPIRVLEQVKGVIAALDVPPTQSPNDPVTEVFRLQYADPMRAAAWLLAALPGTKVMVDHGTRTLTITAAPLALNQAKALLEKLDTPSPTEITSEVVRVRSLDAEAAANVIKQALPSLAVTGDRTIGAVILQGPRSEVERAKNILASLETQGQPGPAQLRVEVIPVRYTTPSEFLTETSTSRTAEELAQTVLNALQPVFPEIRIGVDKRGQNLVVTGTQQAVDAVKDLVAKLDVISPQVALEVRVVEVAANTLSNIGISMSPIIGSTYTETNPNTNPMIFGRTPLNITVILNALAEKGQAKILANPTIAAMDGRRALIRTGDDIPLVVRQIFGSTVLENVVTFRAGVTLEIIPKISPDGIITVILKPTVSTITGVTNQGAPQISVREVQTTLMVKDGETIVIGGLLEERDIVQMTKIPLLGDLPILGRLFRSERKDHRRTELIITVTPRILKSPLSEPPRQEPSEP